MTGPRTALNVVSPPGQRGRSVLLLAALCLITMPQSYRGGAELSHPHAIFQFWLEDGHAATNHHHGDGVADHDHPAASAYDAPAERENEVRATATDDTPTISQMTTSAEATDAIGSVLGMWFVLLLATAKGVFAVRRLGPGLAPQPERPPPRFALAWA
jgi:hypothetical protein